VAVDNIGTAVVENDLCLLAGRVRAIDGDTLVVVTADGKHAFRVKSTDTRKVDTVIDPVLLDDVTSGVDGKQPLSSNLTALAGLTGAANKLPAFSGLGTMTLVDLTTLVQAAAGAFTTTAPTSAVAATGANDLVRKGEVDAVVVLLSGYILGKQDVNANLSAIAGLTSAADKLAYFTGSGTAAVSTLTSFIRGLLDDADAATARTTLGLGSLATQSVRSLDVCLATIYATGMPWSAMPSAHTLAFNSLGTIRRVDLTNYTQCRLRVIQANAAASGAKLRLRYATSFGTTAAGYSAIGSGATEVDVSLSTSSSQSLASSWFDLESAAKADVWVACTGISGNGSTSPSFFSINAEFR